MLRAGRGWGVRSWDTIGPGQFICEFVGQVLQRAEVGERSDEYCFDLRISGNRSWKVCPPPQHAG